MQNITEIIKQEQARLTGSDDETLRQRVRIAVQNIEKARKQYQRAEIDLADARKVLDDAERVLKDAESDPSKLPELPKATTTLVEQMRQPSVIEQIRRLADPQPWVQPEPIRRLPRPREIWCYAGTPQSLDAQA